MHPSDPFDPWIFGLLMACGAGLGAAVAAIVVFSRPPGAPGLPPPVAAPVPAPPAPDHAGSGLGAVLGVLVLLGIVGAVLRARQEQQSDE